MTLSLRYSYNLPCSVIAGRLEGVVSKGEHPREANMEGQSTDDLRQTLDEYKTQQEQVYMYIYIFWPQTRSEIGFS